MNLWENIGVGVILWIYSTSNFIPILNVWIVHNWLWERLLMFIGSVVHTSGDRAQELCNNLLVSPFNAMMYKVWCNLSVDQSTLTSRTNHCSRMARWTSWTLKATHFQTSVTSTSHLPILAWHTWSYPQFWKWTYFVHLPLVPMPFYNNDALLPLLATP